MGREALTSYEEGKKHLKRIKVSNQSSILFCSTESIKINSEILQYAKLSRNSYHLALEERKKKDEAARKLKNEKKRIKDQLTILVRKKAKLPSDMALQAQKIEKEIRELQKKKKKNFENLIFTIILCSLTLFLYISFHHN